MVIAIKSRISDNFGDAINEVLRIINIVHKRNKTDNEVIFDLNGCTFSNPFLLAALHLLGNRYRNEGLIITFSSGTSNLGYREYLNTVKFPETVLSEHYSEFDFNALLETYITKTYIPLISFTTAKTQELALSREKTISTLSKILSAQCNLKGNIKSAIIYLIDEAINNILDHSQTDKGVIFAQYYPSKNYMDLCVGDGGIGILKSYQNNDVPEINTDKEALLKAVNGLSTKDNPDSRGFGISTSIKMLVEGLRGKYFLYSGRASFINTTENQSIVEFPENVSWQGTLLFLRIPVLINDSFNYINYIDTSN